MAVQVGLLRRLSGIPSFLVSIPAKISLSSEPGGEDIGGKHRRTEDHFPIRNFKLSPMSLPVQCYMRHLTCALQELLGWFLLS